jgi:hypothetical protein
MPLSVSHSTEAVLNPVVIIPAHKNAALLTPQEVEQQYLKISRRAVARLRALGLPPLLETVPGCNPHREEQIERFLAERARVACSEAPKRCAIYARADSPFDPSDLIAEQVEACNAHCRRTGWKFVATCVDFGPPNTRKNMRGGFRSLLEQAALGEFDVLLVYDRSHVGTRVNDIRSFVGQLADANVRVCEISPVPLTRRAELFSPSRTSHRLYACGVSNDWG